MDTTVLDKARSGVYNQREIEGVSKALLAKYFVTLKDDGGDKTYKASDKLKKMITYNQLNFLDNSWPMKNKFDVIFCRNALIYFDKDLQNKLITKFKDLLPQKALFCLGHSESIGENKEFFSTEGMTTFRKL